MLVWSVVVGVAGALATAAFRESIALLQRAFAGAEGSFVDMARGLPWTTRIWLPAAGGLIGARGLTGPVADRLEEAIQFVTTEARAQAVRAFRGAAGRVRIRGGARTVELSSV